MYKLSFLMLLCVLPMLIQAQKNKKLIYSFSHIDNIVVDANIADWVGNLNTTQGELWSFGISEQNNQLTVAISIKDKSLQAEALRGGVFVNISYNEKKKDGARLVFPYLDRERKRALMNDEERGSKNFEEKILENTNGYFMSGFGRVRDGLLALQNDYNIVAKAQIDSNDNLVCEAKIPLDLVGLKSDKIVVQIGINTQYSMIKRISSNNNSGRGMYSSRTIGRGALTPTSKNPYKDETEVWIIDSIKR